MLKWYHNKQYIYYLFITITDECWRYSPKKTWRERMWILSRYVCWHRQLARSVQPGSQFLRKYLEQRLWKEAFEYRGCVKITTAYDQCVLVLKVVKYKYIYMLSAERQKDLSRKSKVGPGMNEWKVSLYTAEKTVQAILSHPMVIY